MKKIVIFVSLSLYFIDDNSQNQIVTRQKRQIKKDSNIRFWRSLSRAGLINDPDIVVNAISKHFKNGHEYKRCYFFNKITRSITNALRPLFVCHRFILGQS